MAADVSISQTLREWFRDESTQHGFFPAVTTFLAKLWEFLLDSTPARRRSRYGDVDFDWQHRVNTTGATVRARERFLGLFHSPYQPTEPTLFHEMLDAIERTGANLSAFTFIDIGSGKGRVLLMAADYPFRRILGVELFPQLHQAAEENIRQYASPVQRRNAMESICADARSFPFPSGPLLIYLFNPLPASGLTKLLDNLEESLTAEPRKTLILYHNPLLEPLLAHRAAFRKLSGTHQYSVFGNGPKI
jgi:SAM-dependent methyltransferase